MDNPRYADVDGIRTRYFEAGQGDPLILVHGGRFGLTSCADAWELNFTDLAQSFRVYAIDKIGMGFTDNPRSDNEYVIDSQVQHLYHFMQQLGIEKAHLAGVSRGGYAITRLALDHPENVRSLIVINSSSVTNTLNPVYNEWRKRASQMEARDGVRYLIAVNSYSDQHITERLVDVELEITNLSKTQEARAKMDGGLVDRFNSDLLQRVEELKQDIREGGIKMPTLLLWGFNDPSATMERCGKPAIDLFLPSVADCEMHILNHAGHYSFREQPEAFKDVVTNFIMRRKREDATYSASRSQHSDHIAKNRA